MKTDNPQKLKFQKLLSALMIVIGLLLLAFMVIVEDEPGAIPLLLIVLGAGFYIYTKFKIRPLRP